MARTRDIRTNQADVSCDVCGRTLLRGEVAEPFLVGGQRRQVCELCTPRAQHEGWIRESGADELALRHPRHERRRGVLERLRERRGREVADGAEAEAEAVRQTGPISRVRRVRRSDEAPGEEEAPAPAAAAERAAGVVQPVREPRHVRAVPTNADLKMQRALDVFNGSEFTRTVGGVARSLGPPAVCVRPLVERPSVVTITVMWELSWYRFEVDLSDEGSGVRRDAQGDELSELDEAEQTPNASADERGALSLAAA